MTIRTWRNDFLKICKKCNWFYKEGRNRYRYKCGKYGIHIYKAYDCKKLNAVKRQAKEISKKALDEAFNKLVTWE